MPPLTTRDELPDDDHTTREPGTLAELTPLELHIRLWDPAEHLRLTEKSPTPPRPDGAANAWPEERAA